MSCSVVLSLVLDIGNLCPLFSYSASLEINLFYLSSKKATIDFVNFSFLFLYVFLYLFLLLVLFAASAHFGFSQLFFVFLEWNFRLSNLLICLPVFSLTTFPTAVVVKLIFYSNSRIFCSQEIKNIIF